MQISSTQKIKILFLTENVSTNVPSSLMWFIQMKELLSGHFITSLNDLEYEEYDIIFINRLNPKLLFKALAHSRNAHIGTLFAEVNPNNEFMRNFDFLFSHSLMMQELFMPYSGRIYKTNDYWSSKGKKLKVHKNGDQLILGYHGNELHYRKDFFPNLSGALQKLALTHDFLLRVVIKNADKQPRISGIKSEFIEWEYYTYEDHLETFDIGLCPSVSTINGLKDPLSYIRNPNRIALLLFWGIPSVGSPIADSLQTFVHGESIFYAVGKHSWYQHLDNLMRDASLRNEIGNNGRKIVNKKFTEEAVVEYISKIFLDEAKCDCGKKPWLGSKEEDLKKNYRKYMIRENIKIKVLKQKLKQIVFLREPTVSGNLS